MPPRKGCRCRCSRQRSPQAFRPWPQSYSLLLHGPTGAHGHSLSQVCAVHAGELQVWGPGNNCGQMPTIRQKENPDNLANLANSHVSADPCNMTIMVCVSGTLLKIRPMADENAPMNLHRNASGHKCCTIQARRGC
eukprot:350494-Chlamydomonas_euryale.AAC.16